MWHCWKSSAIATMSPSDTSPPATVIQVEKVPDESVSLQEWMLSRLPSLAAKLDARPSLYQERDIIKQFCVQFYTRSSVLLVGDEGCGKTTAAMILARQMQSNFFHGIELLWFDSDNLPTRLSLNPRLFYFIVVDDFLGKYPSESLKKWKKFCEFYRSLCLPSVRKFFLLMTSRAAMLQSIRASAAAEVLALVNTMCMSTVAFDHRKMWDTVTLKVNMDTPDFNELPSIGFPLCCHLLPHVSQAVQAILFQRPRFALRKAVREIMDAIDIARTAFALLAVTEGYLDTDVFVDLSILQASPYWQPLQSLQENSVAIETVREIESFYRNCPGLVMIEDNFVSFTSESIREAVLVVLCDSHAKFLSETCSQRLISQIAMATSDACDSSDQAEKPELPAEAKSAFMKRLVKDIEAQNCHETFMSYLFQHDSVKEELTRYFSEMAVMEKWMKNIEENHLHFIIYAGAVDFVFKFALSFLDTKNYRVVLQALISCCYWGHSNEIDGLMKHLQKKKALKKSLQTATIKQIVTGDLPDLDSRAEPNWSEAPLSPEETLLTLAAGRGNDAVVKKLVNMKIDLNTLGADGRTALMHFCAQGNGKMAQFLLRQKADPCLTDRDGNTALMYALQRGEWDIPQELIDDSTSHILNKAHQSPLMFACAGGWRVQTIDYLIKKGCNPLLKDDSDSSCLHYACREGHTDVVAHLLQNKKLDAGASACEDITPLLYAVSSPGRTQLSELLLKSKAARTAIDHPTFYMAGGSCDANVLLRIFSAHRPDEAEIGKAISGACVLGNADVLRFLLPYAVDPTGSLTLVNLRSLHDVCRGGSIDCLEYLLTRMCYNVKTTLGVTPIMRALEYGHLKVAQALQRLGAHINVKDNLNQDCLHYAVLSDSNRVLEWCVKEQKMEINNKNNQNVTPLIKASASGKPRAVKYLLNNGADPTATDWDGNTGMHLAAQAGHLDVLETFLKSVGSAGLSVPNKSGQTPVQILIEAGHAHFADVLTQRFQFKTSAVNRDERGVQQSP